MGQQQSISLLRLRAQSSQQPAIAAFGKRGIELIVIQPEQINEQHRSQQQRPQTTRRRLHACSQQHP